jgi:hypothetical protein
MEANMGYRQMDAIFRPGDSSAFGIWHALQRTSSLHLCFFNRSLHRCFRLPKIRHLPKSRHSTAISSRMFSIACKWPPDCLSTVAVAGKGVKAEHREITDDVENREISAAKIHGFYLKWPYGCGADHGVEDAF